MSRADELPQEIVYAVARALYKCEKRRAEHCDEVLSVAAGKTLKPSMEPWDEVAEIYTGDAKAAINAYLLAAYTDEAA